MVPSRLLSCLMAAVLLGTLASCDKVQEARNQANAVAALSETAGSLEEKANEMQAKTEARRAKGDTLAIPYKDLQGYLPAEVAGYQKAGDPDGSMMNMSGMSYSSCSQEYKAGPEDNPKTLKVTIVDYNGAADMYVASTGLLATGFSMEDDQQRIQGIDLGIKDVKALETIQKKDHHATITVGVANRFFVVVEANQQDNIDVVKKAVEQIDLKKLAAL